VCLLLDPTLVKLAAAPQHGRAHRQQLTCLLDTLAGIKQRLPPRSRCCAYVSNHLVALHSKLLRKWLLSGVLQQLPAGVTTPNSVSAAKQVGGVGVVDSQFRGGR
jgi:hypothetical protein